MSTTVAACRVHGDCLLFSRVLPYGSATVRHVGGQDAGAVREVRRAGGFSTTQR